MSAAGVVETLTVAEAALRWGKSKATILQWASTGVVDAVKVDRRWLVDGASVAAYAVRPRVTSSTTRPRVRSSRPEVKLPAEPLLRLVDVHGGAAALGVREKSKEQQALVRARREGMLTLKAADELCVRLLGLNPGEVWGDAYYAV